MNAYEKVHVPFAQLGPEERFFYWFAAQAAVLCLRPYLTAIGAAGEEIWLSRVWDDTSSAPQMRRSSSGIQSAWSRT